MLTVKVKVQDKDLKRVIKQLPSIHKQIVGDAQRLGFAGQRYLKKIIPKSKLNKPHLRDSFALRVKAQKRGILLTLHSKFVYARALDTGASIPARSPQKKKFMRFVAESGDLVYTKRAKGFSISGIGYADKTGRYLVSNVGRYVDLTLGRYLGPTGFWAGMYRAMEVLGGETSGGRFKVLPYKLTQRVKEASKKRIY